MPSRTQACDRLVTLQHAPSHSSLFRPDQTGPSFPPRSLPPVRLPSPLLFPSRLTPASLVDKHAASLACRRRSSRPRAPACPSRLPLVTTSVQQASEQAFECSRVLLDFFSCVTRVGRFRSARFAVLCVPLRRCVQAANLSALELYPSLRGCTPSLCPQLVDSTFPNQQSSVDQSCASLCTPRTPQRVSASLPRRHLSPSDRTRPTRTRPHAHTPTRTRPNRDPATLLLTRCQSRTAANTRSSGGGPFPTHTLPHPRKWTIAASAATTRAYRHRTPHAPQHHTPFRPRNRRTHSNSMRSPGESENRAIGESSRISAPAPYPYP